jgi:hypothetical protein
VNECPFCKEVIEDEAVRCQHCGGLPGGDYDSFEQDKPEAVLLLHEREQRKGQTCCRVCVSVFILSWGCFGAGLITGKYPDRLNWMLGIVTFCVLTLTLYVGMQVEKLKRRLDMKWPDASSL